MHWFKCSLLATTLCASYWQNSAALTELPNKVAETTIPAEPKEDKTTFENSDSTLFESVSTEKLFQDITATLTQRELQGAVNNTGKPKSSNFTSLNTDVQISAKSGQKREVENVTFNDIKPFLLFPILPFLFPPKIEENLVPEKNELTSPVNETSKVDGNPTDVKPFIFFDFAFIRRIPLNHSSENSNNSKIINIKKLSVNETENSKTNFQKNRRRRNTNFKKDSPGFFDDSPLFPDSELDEFLPKPDLFFPDLPSHHKPLRESNRRKRDQKKMDLKDDLKLFFDAFDEAFMRIKREFERTDPILNFLRGGEQPFGEEKKEDFNPFNQIPSVQEKPRFKWKIQRNIKKLNNRQDGLNKGQEGPMIIVDKVVKIGEFRVHDDKDKSKRLKKGAEASSKKFLGDNDEMTSNEIDETFPKNIFELIRQKENKRERRHHPVGQTFTKILSKEIKILPQMNTSFLTVGNNTTVELMKETVNDTKKAFNCGNLRKVIDSLKSKIKLELSNSGEPTVDRLKRRDSNYYEALNFKKASYDNLKKNITELLNQFLELAKNLDDAKLMKKLEDGERDGAGSFDWTEKETLQNAKILEKDYRENRQKKDTNLEDEYVEFAKKERQVADLNFLFLTVTLPTVFIFALALLICFFSLQVKGKICSKLFRPRQVFIVEDENTSTQLKNTTGIKSSPKVQAF